MAAATYGFTHKLLRSDARSTPSTAVLFLRHTRTTLNQLLDMLLHLQCSTAYLSWLVNCGLSDVVEDGEWRLKREWGRRLTEPGRENRSRARVEWVLVLTQFIISLRGEAVGDNIFDWLVVSEHSLHWSKLCVER